MVKPRSLTRVFQEQNKFLFNQEKPNAWHCRILRASATVGSSFTIEWPEWNDQAFLIRSKDLGKHRNIKFYHDTIPMFADKIIDYPGQAIALLVAPDIEQLSKIEREVIITYHSPESLDDSIPDFRIHSSRKVQSGDVEQAFTESYRTISSEFRLDSWLKMHHEPRGVLAEWKSDTLWVQCSTSWPHLVRRLISESTGLTQRNITVTSLPSAYLPDRFIVDSSIIACYASMAALTCMKPVQLFLSGNEDTHWGTRQPPLQAHIKTGHTPDGKLLAMKAEIEVDLGAFPIASQETLIAMLSGLCSTYRCPHMELSVRILQSDHTPMFMQSSFGLPAIQHALEHHVMRICTEFDVDHLSWKGQNLLAKADITAYGPILEHTAQAHQVLVDASRNADYRRKFAAFELQRKQRTGIPPAGHDIRRHSGHFLRGIGIALAYQPNGLFTNIELACRARVRLKLSADGHLEITVPMHATNLALKDAWTTCLEAIVGIEERNMSFSRFSTDQIDDSGPARFSRVASLYSPLIATAARSLKQKMSRQQGPIEVKLSMPNLKRLKWDSESFSGSPFLSRSWVSAVVELHVDQVSLEPIVDQVWLSISAGSILHPERATTIVRQAVIESLSRLGNAGHSIFNRTTNRPKTPRIHVDFLNQERYADIEQRLLHAGGIGELAYSVIPAAFSNALAQAIGNLPDRIPCNSKEICRILTEAPHIIENTDPNANRNKEHT